MKRNMIDKKNLVKDLQTLLKTVENYNHPESLSELIKIYKKTIPFWRRNWILAYLLQEKYGLAGTRDNLKGSNSRKNNKKETSSRIKPHQANDGASVPENTSDHTRDEDIAITLWINVGRDRKMNRNNLRNFIVANSTINIDNVVDIRIKHNCSFISFSDLTTADSLTEAINGIKFKGKKLLVKPAKQNESSD